MQGYIPGGAFIDLKYTPAEISALNLCYLEETSVRSPAASQGRSSPSTCLSLCPLPWGPRVSPMSRGQGGKVRSSDTVKKWRSQSCYLFPQHHRGAAYIEEERIRVRFGVLTMMCDSTIYWNEAIMRISIDHRLFISHEWAAWNFTEDNDKCSRADGVGCEGKEPGCLLIVLYESCSFSVMATVV